MLTTSIKTSYGKVRGEIVGPVCLIVPPSGFLMDERVIPPVGPPLVAGALEAAEIEVEYLDLAGVNNYKEAVIDHCLNSKAVCFGITATTPQLPAAVEVAKAIRSVRTDARLILGGPHVTLVNAARKREVREGKRGRSSIAFDKLQMFDVLVAGDGEEAIFIACMPNAPKLVDADDPKSPLFLTNARLTELPFPARHLVDMDSYHYYIDRKRAYPIIAQLGCPFGCGFCGGRLSPTFRRVRTRTSENVVAEMLHMSRTMNCSGFMFYDDELNVNRSILELMHLIAKAQKDHGLEWRLRGFVKAELFTDDQARAMYEAGFREILTGFESGSPKILININKKATQEDNTRCVEIAQRHGLRVKALMSIGHPGESEQTILETRDWLLKTKPNRFDLTIITCYPGTPYYDEAEPCLTQEGVWTYTHPKTGDRLYQREVDYAETADYYKGNIGEYKAYVFTDELSSEQLVALRDAVEREVREKLDIPFDQSAQAINYEHSMGQRGPLPSNILRVSAHTPAMR